MDDLKIEVEEQGPIEVVRLIGVLARLEVYKLKTSLDALVAHRKNYFILDLTDISCIDSAGIGLIFRLQEQVTKRGGGLNLVVPQSSQVQRPLEVVSMSKSIRTYMNFFDALQEMNESFGLTATLDPILSSPPEHIPVFQAEAERATCLEDVIITLRSMAGRLATIEERMEILEKKPPAH